MDQIIQVFFNAAVFERAWPFLWRGVQMTVLLSLVIVPIGLASGLAVADNYLYVADGESGLSVVDIDAPTHPTSLRTATRAAPCPAGPALP